MKQLLTIVLTCLLSIGLMTQVAEAKRLGGGKSLGMQRQAAPQQAPKAPAAAPAPAPGQPAAAAPQAGMKWGGLLAGLAAGGLLAALFAGGAFAGIKILDVLMIALLIGAVFFIIRMLRRRSEPAIQRPMQYAGMGGQSSPLPVEPVAPFGAASQPQAASAAAYPAGFEPEPFLRQAKQAFIKLQDANDVGNAYDIRDYVTPALFNEIAAQIAERGAAAQKTDLVTLNADLVEVVTEGDMAIASVRFSGLIRETAGAVAEPFDEIWHVQKSLSDPKSTWLVSGIQQTA